MLIISKEYITDTSGSAITAEEDYHKKGEDLYLIVQYNVNGNGRIIGRGTSKEINEKLLKIIDAIKTNAEWVDIR